MKVSSTLLALLPPAASVLSHSLAPPPPPPPPPPPTTPRPALRASQPICETSTGSPLVADILATAHALAGLCRPQNALGSKCTLLESRGTAAVSMCREFQTHCGGVGEAAEAVARECAVQLEGGRRVAGGFVEYRRGRVYGRIVVHHA